MKQDAEDISKLSKILSEKIKECGLKKDEKYQLIQLVDDLILVWCNEEACFYAQILQNSPSSEADTCNVQALVLSKPPVWEVKHIILNKSGTGVLLVGNEGVAVVELPKRWGNPPLFEGGVETLTCRVEYIGEQFFTCYPHIKIISADWHPGSVDQTSIVVLSSDNYLRIYKLPYLDIPEQAIAVGKSCNFNKEGRKFGVGEGAVSFGIGPPVCINEGGPAVSRRDDEQRGSTSVGDLSTSVVDKFEEETRKQKERYQDLLWPVFILYNNGDVYYTLTSLNKRSTRKRFPLSGPLSMLPSSFDNYGLDFCSLLVLPSSPIVLVIANTDGFLHHCIVMETPRRDGEETGVQGDNTLSQTLEVETLSMSVSELSLDIPSSSVSVYLHVYESVRLDLSNVEGESAGGGEEGTLSRSLSSQLSLTADPNTPARYWVHHSEGCHGVSVPLVERLLAQDTEFPETDLECRVEHLICTRPLTTSSPCCVAGLCLSPSFRVFVLLSSGNIHRVPLPSLLSPRGPPLFQLVGAEGEREEGGVRKVHRESFEEHIRSILQRSLSQPLLMSGSWPESSPDEVLRLIKKVTHTLRESYVKPQIKAREEIRRRQNILLEQKSHLKRELSVLLGEKKALTDKAHDLAEKYEETSDSHDHLMKRLEVIIGSLVRRLPTLSSSERRMLQELQEMTDKTKTFQMQLKQIHSKDQWQTSQMEKERSNEALRKPSQATAALSDNQLTCLKVSLGKESDKLSVLVKKINQMKKEVGL